MMGVRTMEPRRFPARAVLGLLLLATGALAGGYQATHGDPRNWARIAKGTEVFFCWGIASLLGCLLLGGHALWNSPWFERLDWLLPVRGRWARYLGATVWALLWFVFIALTLWPFAVMY